MNERKLENRGTTGRGRKITVESPIGIRELRFLDKYMETGDLVLAMKEAGFEGSDRSLRQKGYNVLKKPNIAYEYNERMKRFKKKSLASSEEVMEYLTKVMRGEVKDQFGLDAPLAERTKAAQELAKRTIDVENRAQGQADSVVKIQIDWGR